MQEFNVTEYEDVVKKLLSAKDATSFTNQVRRLQSVTEMYYSKAQTTDTNTGKKETPDKIVS